jgi:hypothetical protein
VISDSFSNMEAELGRRFESKGNYVENTAGEMRSSLKEEF